MKNDKHCYTSLQTKTWMMSKGVYNVKSKCSIASFQVFMSNKQIYIRATSTETARNNEKASNINTHAQESLGINTNR